MQDSPLDVERDSAQVQDFMTELEATFRTSPLWRGSGPEEVQAASEGLEKYLMTKLYPRTFAMYAEDRAIDAQLSSRCATPSLRRAHGGAWNLSLVGF